MFSVYRVFSVNIEFTVCIEIVQSIQCEQRVFSVNSEQRVYSIYSVYHQISMGQGQEERARKAITTAILKGHWLMLQNCHLCLEFCEELIVTMVDTDEMHRNFKLWLTTDFHKERS